MNIKIPTVDFGEDKEIDLFVGINLKVSKKNGVTFNGGFVKEKQGQSKTQQEKQKKKKENKEQARSLQSKKSGEVEI